MARTAPNKPPRKNKPGAVLERIDILGDKDLCSAANALLDAKIKLHAVLDRLNKQKYICPFNTDRHRIEMDVIRIENAIRQVETTYDTLFRVGS